MGLAPGAHGANRTGSIADIHGDRDCVSRPIDNRDRAAAGVAHIHFVGSWIDRDALRVRACREAGDDAVVRAVQHSQSIGPVKAGVDYVRLGVDRNRIRSAGHRNVSD